MSFLLAIVGRPNVGKSTLFNRLTGKKLALVDDTPGLTRDWQEAEARVGPMRLRIMDTAGLEDAKGDVLPARMRDQTFTAIDRADAVLFVIDASVGVVPHDRVFADHLRKQNKPVILLANKCDSRAARYQLGELQRLGFGEPIPFSATHGEGLADLYEALAPLEGQFGPIADTPLPRRRSRKSLEELPDAEADPISHEPIHVAIVGRPNAGKSTLMNRLLGENRVLTGPEAGITRDAITVDWSFEGQRYRLVDTAGLRRKARIEADIEKMAVGDSLHAIRFAQVVVLMMDAEIPFEKQDVVIADLVEREGRGLVIAVNKWDKVKDKDAFRTQLMHQLADRLPQLPHAPMIPISAQDGWHTDRLMREVASLFRRWNSRVPTARLNEWLEAALIAHPPPLAGGRQLKCRYVTQVKTRPPTFALFTNRPKDVPEHYARYLMHSLRAAFDLEGVPARLLMRGGKNPYAKEK
jgi:GTP-binding protein